RPVKKAAPREYWIGIAVAPIGPVLRAQLKLPPEHKVLVSAVYPDTPAAKAGIALHDIIVSLDGKPVTDPADLAKLVQAKGEKPLELELAGRGGSRRTVDLIPFRKKAAEGQPAGTDAAESPAPSAYFYDIVRPGVVLDSTGTRRLSVPPLMDYQADA